MKNKIIKLKKHFGSREAVQKVLGIEKRTYYGLMASTRKKPYPCGKPLRILIDRTLKDIKIFLKALELTCIEGYIHHKWKEISYLTEEQNIKNISQALTERINLILRD